MARIIIVGAGPAGATLALLLVQRGIAVTLIEASRTFQRIFRGEGLMPSGLDALAQMNLTALLDRIPHRPLDAWEFIINQRFFFRVIEPIEAGGQSCMLVSQPALLEALITAAQAYPHFEFIQNTPVQGLLWQNQRVSGVILAGDRQLSADLVIGADGRASSVRQHAHLQMNQQDQNFNILWFKLASGPQFPAENVFYSILKGRDAFGLFHSSEGNLQVGWALHEHNAEDWKHIDWVERLASTSPPWLAQHICTHADTLERPVLLTVMVGQCSHWSAPGVLLLGDAAHPMSPIRAQGINMALRDVIVAANYLVPILQTQLESGAFSHDGLWKAIDTALPHIQAQREPEIIRVQELQRQEVAQAELLAKSPLLPWTVSLFAPLLRQPVRQSWLRRQRQLRQGVIPISLDVLTDQ
jgi:2-polyprenyl-6-methoxyphenol hydroxylase-like FAD-dependent oxidoreductase